MNEIKNKIYSRQEVKEVLNLISASKKIVGFTSGAFDLLHSGHLDYLEKSRAQCDVLVVAVNSDSSIKSYKDPARPIRPQEERARLVAGLKCVDYVFIFSEDNNNQNIKELQPAIYFKAGDYDKSKLSSAPLVEAYGGKIEIVPFLSGFSTSSIIEDICFRFGGVYASPIEVVRPKDKQKAVLIDRDGTINEFVEYLHEPEKFKLIPGVVEALQNFQAAGYRIAIVTNQPGIGMGYFSKEDYYALTKEFLKIVSKAGVAIDKIYYCPHSKADKCKCRKPSTGMIERAVQEMNLDLSACYVIGDSSIDMMLAKNAGCKAILVKTGMSGQDGNYDAKPDFVAKDLKEASELIIKS